MSTTKRTTKLAAFPFFSILFLSLLLLCIKLAHLPFDVSKKKQKIVLGGSQTYPADETIGMPLSVESRNVTLGDGRIATFALESKHGKVVLFTVGLSILLLEAILAELAAALGAEKVIRMPRLIQRSHAFLLKGEESERFSKTKKKRGQ